MYVCLCARIVDTTKLARTEMVRLSENATWISHPRHPGDVLTIALNLHLDELTWLGTMDPLVSETLLKNPKV